MNADFLPAQSQTSPSAPDPWEDAETAQLRAFLKLSYTERFHLMMHALEFMNMLRPGSFGPVKSEKCE
jgi:hypothetical protein